MQEQIQDVPSQNDNIIPIVKPRITGPGKLFGGAIKTYHQGFGKFIKMAGIMVLGYIPAGIIYWVYYLANNRLDLSLVYYVIFAILMLVAVVFMIYFSISSQVGIILLASDSQSKNFKDTFKKARHLFWAFLVVTLVTGFMVFLWSILFIIPGIIFATYYTFSSYALIFEDFKNTSALKRSRELVKNYWWPVVGRTLYVSILYLIFSIIISIPAYLTGQQSTFAQIWQYVTSLINIVVAPILVIYQYSIFKDLQKIKGQSQLEDKTGKRVVSIVITIIAAIVLTVIFGLIFLLT